MYLKLLTIFVFGFFLISGCDQARTQSANQDEINQSSERKTGSSSEMQETEEQVSDADASDNTDKTKSENAEKQTNQPKTVREFFMLLPEKYFTLEGCFREKDKDCKQARIDYLKDFAEVEDIKNGYLKGGCDGAQSCIEMTIFKRPDKTYVVALSTSAEMIEETYFLDYKNGVWSDISTKVVPAFSKKNMYELPRYGTTVKVFAKKVIEKGDDYEISEKGEKLYDLEWKDGKFLKVKGKR